MQRRIRGILGVALGATLLLGGCGTGDGDAERTAAVQTQPDTQLPAAGQPGASDMAQSAPQVEPNMRLEVNISARELYVIRDGQRVATHPVAVGTSEWPTQTGEWTVGQVVWNPEWIPPNESWAEDRDRKAPGDPENPLGRAQLVYDAPRTVHGTNDPSSIGQAVSHGSIRVSNDVAVELARQVMEAGGAGRDQAWYRRVQENRNERESVSIPNPIPIRVYERG
ncbi:MAG: L,D-transpeptidase [Gemmatimonadetes bacterium]|nr:L,D-transpeptidase [Gemmatimonadota bacterium]